MSADSTFHDLMARLRGGDARAEAAAAEIFHRFARRLIGLAARHLDDRLRQKVDPEDVMQSALKSFFARQADGQYDLSGWDSLWSMLVVITLRKCGHKAEHFRAACRDVGREQALPDLDEPAHSWEALSREPTPSQAALLAEAVRQVMATLADERERTVLELSLQGCPLPEISGRVGRSERTVQRVLTRVRKRLERMRDEGEARQAPQDPETSPTR
jgi:RNA polymerase sigma-70 factor (ECF subfamily)